MTEVGLHSYLRRHTCKPLEEGIKLVFEHLFASEELIRDLLMEITITRDDLLRLSVCSAEELTDLRVDEILSLIGDDLATSLSTEEVPLAHIGCEVLRADLWIKSKSHHHRSCDFSRSLDIRARTSRDVLRTEEYLLSHASTIEGRELVEVFRLRSVGTIFLWEEPRDTTSTTTREDRDLVHRISMGEHLPDDRMSDLVDRCEALLMLGHTERLLLIAHHDLFD